MAGKTISFAAASVTTTQAIPISILTRSPGSTTSRPTSRAMASTIPFWRNSVSRQLHAMSDHAAPAGGRDLRRSSTRSITRAEANRNTPA